LLHTDAGLDQDATSFRRVTTLDIGQQAQPTTHPFSFS
jgi:hypothetical protein